MTHRNLIIICTCGLCMWWRPKRQLVALDPYVDLVRRLYRVIQEGKI